MIAGVKRSAGRSVSRRRA